MIFYARKDSNGNKEELIHHLNLTSKLCGEFANEFGNKKVGEFIGGLHDIGKLSIRFQNVLEGKEQKVNHAFASGLISQLGIKSFFETIELANIVSSIMINHHTELEYKTQNDFPLTKEKMDYLFSNKPISLMDSNQKIYSFDNQNEILSMIKFIKTNKLGFPLKKDDFLDIEHMSNNEKMFYMRMLYSCLVDADYSSSASFSNPTYLNDISSCKLDANKMFDNLTKYRNNIIKNSNSNSKMNDLRNLVYEDCINASKIDKDLLTLTAPTGTAKTLALLGYALNKAKHFNKKRIFIVLPYLSIIEQNAQIYKEICGDENVLVVDSETEVNPNDEKMREMIERWDAPIIITTSVNFFETLFKSKGSKLRKLHNLSNSIIVFDESHNLPSEVLNCSLEIMNTLTKYYQTTILFSTATQPSYKYRQNLDFWNSYEIIKDTNKLYYNYGLIKKLDITWNINKPMSYIELSNLIKDNKNALIVFNTKKQARKMYQEVINMYGSNCCFYITTDLCSQHKIDVINKVKNRMKDGKRTIVVSTQCIETGVDLDFEFLYRELAPLEAIIQSSGRCSRNAKFVGKMMIFITDEKNLYPSNSYKNAANCVQQLLHKYNNKLDINDLNNMDEYYKLLFNTCGFTKDLKALVEDIENKNFIKMSKDYKLIENNQVSIIVPYENCIDIYNNIRDKIIKNNYSISKGDIKYCQKIIVNSYDKKSIEQNPCFESLYIRTKQGISTKYSNFYILNKDLGTYDKNLGLQFNNDVTLIF